MRTKGAITETQKLLVQQQMCDITFWSHRLLTRRLLFGVRVQRAAGGGGGGGNLLRESRVCSVRGGEGGLGGGEGGGVPRVEGRSVVRFGLRQRRGARHRITATTHGLVPRTQTLGRWEVHPALRGFGGRPARLERRLEHVDGKPARERVQGPSLVFICVDQKT